MAHQPAPHTGASLLLRHALGILYWPSCWPRSLHLLVLAPPAISLMLAPGPAWPRTLAFCIILS
jgi:hypothetical protein